MFRVQGSPHQAGRNCPLQDMQSASALLSIPKIRGNKLEVPKNGDSRIWGSTLRRPVIKIANECEAVRPC